MLYQLSYKGKKVFSNVTPPLTRLAEANNRFRLKLEPSAGIEPASQVYKTSTSPCMFTRHYYQKVKVSNSFFGEVGIEPTTFLQGRSTTELFTTIFNHGQFPRFATQRNTVLQESKIGGLCKYRTYPARRRLIYSQNRVLNGIISHN